MKKLVVTGGSSGIGAAIVELLQSEYEVTLIDLHKPQNSTRYIIADLANGSSVESAFKEIGNFDVLVHCAGIYIPKLLADMSNDEIEKQVSVNLTGTIFVNKHALKLMSKGGVIINISSALGLVPEPASPIYCATKAGINMLTKALAQQYASKGVRINAVLPGPVDTPLLRESFPSEEEFKKYEQFNPMRRIAKPSEIAKFVKYVISDDASFITGACLPIDGGESSSSLYSPIKK